MKREKLSIKTHAVAQNESAGAGCDHSPDGSDLNTPLGSLSGGKRCGVSSYWPLHIDQFRSLSLEHLLRDTTRSGALCIRAVSSNFAMAVRNGNQQIIRLDGIKKRGFQMCDEAMLTHLDSLSRICGATEI